MKAETNPIDIIVQTATVELFQHYGVAVAPASPVTASGERPQSEEMVFGAVSFFGDEMSGHMAICVPWAVVSKTLAARGAGTSIELDWMRELTSQLMGRIKNRLGRVQVKITAGLPTASRLRSTPQVAAAMGEGFRYYFRSISGIVTVSLAGRVRPAKLDYTAGPPLAEEGDLLLF